MGNFKSEEKCKECGLIRIVGPEGLCHECWQEAYQQKYPDEMDDRDPYNPCEYSEGYNWDEYDWDSDPDWR